MDKKNLPELTVYISSYLDQILTLVFLSYKVCTEFVIFQFLVIASDTLNRDNPCMSACGVQGA